MSKPETELSQGTEVGSQKYCDLMPGTMLDPERGRHMQRPTTEEESPKPQAPIRRLR